MCVTQVYLNINYICNLCNLIILVEICGVSVCVHYTGLTKQDSNWDCRFLSLSRDQEVNNFTAGKISPDLPRKVAALLGSGKCLSIISRCSQLKSELTVQRWRENGDDRTFRRFL